MHEVSLVSSLLEIIEQQAALQGFDRVRTVFLEVGELTCVEPAALRFCFEAVRGDSVAAQAELQLISEPGRARCQECAAEFAYAALGQACPECGGHRVEITSGRGLRLTELEVETTCARVAAVVTTQASPSGSP